MASRSARSREKKRGSGLKGEEGGGFGLAKQGVEASGVAVMHCIASFLSEPAPGTTPRPC